MELKDLSEFGLKYHRMSGDYLQSKWNQLLDIVGDDPQMLWIVGSTVLVMLVYWFYAGIYTVIDLTNFPKFLRKYKLQPEQNDPVDKAKLIKALKVVLINQIFVGLAATYAGYHLLLKHRNIMDIRVLPSVQTFLIDIAVFAVLEEPMFYYAHRMLHHKSVYKYVHKKHHEWTAPIAAMTFYCHPVEHIVSNYLPVVLSVTLMRSHFITASVFFAMAIINAMTDHSGYSFPFSASSVRFHDYHHAKFNYNYGVFGWLDKLHGTFRESPVTTTSTQSTKTKSIKKVKKNK